ncbi:SIS domain-containing protein, partial [Tyzzerella sp. An114]|uniref:SIS domain-containing protein n=1 Tax=Tyzzerella sp. An114 TaxID=1965545 RepID=UPI001180E587
IYGTGNEQKTIADEFKRVFISAGKIVVPVFDYGEVEFLKSLFKENDVFIIISLSGETKSGIDILKLIIPTKINRISITRLANNTISRLCHLNIFAITQNINNINNLNYELVAVFYMIIDTLFMKYIEYSRRIENEY